MRTIHLTITHTADVAAAVVISGIVIYVLTPEQMRAVDAEAIARVGEIELMRNAGAAIAQRLRAHRSAGRAHRRLRRSRQQRRRRVLRAGRARTEYECTVADDPSSVGRRRALPREPRGGSDVRIVTLPAGEREARALLQNAIGVDGMFGTGARLPLPDAYRHLARALDARERTVLAIDIPSGIDALTGAVADDAVRATLTVTLAAAKPGLLLEPAREYVGELLCAHIGIPEATLAAQPRTFAALDDATFLELLPRRAADTDKRGAGAPLIVAGSTQFPGAAILCTRAAARAGAGYVTVATPGSAAAAVLRAHLVEQVVVELSDAAEPEAVAEELVDISKRNGAVAIGPGLGLDERTAKIFTLFLEANRLPIVVDASGLFHLSKHLDLLRGRPCVVTPHAGEFARLSGLGTIAPGTRVERIREFVDRTEITTLLKGSDTLIYDGATVHINTTGTNALATAGTGDVLTGIIATLLSQGLSPVEAACAGAYWHGLAGRAAARKRRVGVVAGDVVDALSDALPR